MKNIDWESIFLFIMAMAGIIITAIASAIWIVLLQFIGENFKWLLLAGTALTLGYWYL